MRNNECKSKTNKPKSRFEECHIALGTRPEKGHLPPQAKIANEIVCDHVCDKLYPPLL
jgi:hypothetical protein